MNAPSAQPLVIDLEANLSLHPIGAEIFVPFTIERLAVPGDPAIVELAVSMINETGQEQNQIVHLAWQPSSASTKPLAVQERVRTEWGALGVACALLPALLNLRILSVALEGERFDYRVGNGRGE